MNATAQTLDRHIDIESDLLVSEASKAVSPNIGQLQYVVFKKTDEGTRVSASDNHRAVTGFTPRLLPTDEPTVVYVPPVNPSWDDAAKRFEVADGSLPDIERLFHEPRTYFKSVSISRSGSVGRDGSDPLGMWSYFDGTRRKPSGLAWLVLRDGELAVRLGMRTPYERGRMVAATMFEDEPRKVMNADWDGSDTFLGVFDAGLLPPLRACSELRFLTGLNALYARRGAIEYMTMPVRGYWNE